MRGVVVVAAVVAALWSASAEAKDLQGRAGLGYENTLVLGEAGERGSSIAVRFWAKKNLFIGGQLGFTSFDPAEDDVDSESSFGVGVSGGYAVIQEEQANVYVGGGLQFGSVPVDDPATGEHETKTMTGLNFGLGTEFFLTGLPSLGFTTAFGLRYVNVGDVGTSIEIGGDEFAVFGIRWYFGKK